MICNFSVALPGIPGTCFYSLATPYNSDMLKSPKPNPTPESSCRKPQIAGFSVYGQEHSAYKVLDSNWENFTGFGLTYLLRRRRPVPCFWPYILGPSSKICTFFWGGLGFRVSGRKSVRLSKKTEVAAIHAGLECGVFAETRLQRLSAFRGSVTWV